jgi:hypothetical protein
MTKIGDMIAKIENIINNSGLLVKLAILKPNSPVLVNTNEITLKNKARIMAFNQELG